MDHQETIDQATELLHGAVFDAVQLVGSDVVRSLLIYLLHEVDTKQIEEGAA